MKCENKMVRALDPSRKSKGNLEVLKSHNQLGHVKTVKVGKNRYLVLKSFTVTETYDVRADTPEGAVRFTNTTGSPWSIPVDVDNGQIFTEVYPYKGESEPDTSMEDPVLTLGNRIYHDEE
jgi:hypothetical protein